MSLEASGPAWTSVLLYTDVHASGHGFYTVQSRNEAHKTVQKIYGRTRGGGGRTTAPPPLNTPLAVNMCLNFQVFSIYCR